MPSVGDNMDEKQASNYDTIPIKIPKEYEKIIPKDTSLINNSI